MQALKGALDNTSKFSYCINFIHDVESDRQFTNTIGKFSNILSESQEIVNFCEACTTWECD